MKNFRFVLFTLFTLGGFAPAADLPPLDLFRDKEVVETFASIPVQESGRIKPLENVASYRLLRFRARRSIWLTENGEMDGKPLIDPATQKPIVKEGSTPEKPAPVKLGPVEWMLMSWFRPDIGRIVPLFKVDNSSAITELGLEAKAKRDQYSYAEIEPARKKMIDKRKLYVEIPAKKQTPEQRMIVQLASSFLDYEMTLEHFDFARRPVGDKPEKLPAEVKIPVRLSQSLNTLTKALHSGGTEADFPWFNDLFRSALGGMMTGNATQQFRIFPPAPGPDNVWSGPGEMIFDAIQTGKEVPANQLAWLAVYEDVPLALPDAAKFKAASKALLTKIQEAAKMRGEGQYVALERHYIRADYFFYAQWIFLAGLVFAVLAVIPSSQMLTRIAYGFICIGLFLSLVGTILGGIWANYSWGRFWGWDPKENGALMIVLMCLIILHARLGGFIREAGLHASNLILGCIVIFSWFGVNQLGVGLHAYGFTEGIWPKIYGYWLVQTILLIVGLAAVKLSAGAKNDAFAWLWNLIGPKLILLAKAAAWLLLSSATILAVTGVIIRCIIMQRPPITTLYETILFIGASSALLGLIAEVVTRRGIGLLITGVAGTACMLLSIQFEASEAADTMQQLQAVLITNFWLSTHVPLINLGYAACMIAALISQAYFFFKLISAFLSMLGLWRPSKAPTEKASSPLPEGPADAPSPAH
ncbi:cytochrome c biogenesis protein CcsA [Prosthecobacter sp.]|uniref:cytochrome c biogenesis protein CcsA n=1 Tax=Prosthecobacter sp. TaxID=1965333 RepID=UPI003784BC63